MGGSSRFSSCSALFMASCDFSSKSDTSRPLEFFSFPHQSAFWAVISCTENTGLAFGLGPPRRHGRLLGRLSSPLSGISIRRRHRQCGVPVWSVRHAHIWFWLLDPGSLLGRGCGLGQPWGSADARARLAVRTDALMRFGRAQ